ncbi:MAG: right-handed parallel beta-helix repeat-containing protein [Bacteroidota bacterium]
MTRTLISILFLASTLFTLNLSAKEVTVATPSEFLKAIGSNTTIKVMPGVYNLTEMADRIANEHISWKEVFDGKELHISGIENLTIKGMPGATLVSSPRYSWVMSFRNSSHISIRDMIIGHTVGGSCVGGVVEFQNGSNIRITNSTLYGSGTEGIKLVNISGFTMNQSVIKECTYDLMTLNNVKNVYFYECSFLNTAEFDLVMIYGGGEIIFESCVFRDNANSEYLPYFFKFEDDADATVVLLNCLFMNNIVQQFTNQLESIKLVNTTFLNNRFEAPDK